MVTGAAGQANLGASKASFTAIASASAIVYSTGLYHVGRTMGDSGSINGGHGQHTGDNDGQETERVSFGRQHFFSWRKSEQYQREADLEGKSEIKKNKL